MPQFANDHFSVEFDPARNSIQIQPKTHPECLLQSELPQAVFGIGEKTLTVKVGADQVFSPSEQQVDGLGACQVFSSRSQVDGVDFLAELAFPQEYPLVLIRMGLTNQTLGKIHQQQFIPLKSTKVVLAQQDAGSADLGCYVNGWQSWSYSGTYAMNQKAVITHLTPFQAPKLYDPATPVLSKAGEYTSDMFGTLMDRTHQTGWLAGFLSQKEHFGHIHMTGKPGLSLTASASGDGAEVPSGATVTTDWLAISFLDLTDPEASGVYLDAAARVNQVHLRHKIPTGWCSWYHYYTQINPDVIHENLYNLAEIRELLPIDMVQIDDGFEKFVGDWLEPRKIFSEEIRLLAEDIKTEGYMPGLWLAPFIIQPRAETYKKHPDWLIHKANGKPASAGWNWEQFCAGLDLTHPEVKEYIRQVISTAVNDWGYPYLKLDFLYAGALAGKRYDPTLTRAQVLRQGMELIREAAGEETYLLGCGAPLGPMLGLVDGMRIGTDVGPDWEPKYMGIEKIFPNDPDIPSAKNAMQNTVSRSAMHNRWWQNDPDCILLRPSTHLTLAEVQTLASLISMSGGLVLLSDAMDEVTHYRMKIAQAMLPVIGQRPQVLDWCDQLHPRKQRLDLKGVLGDWHLLSYTNWGEKPELVTMNLASYGLNTGQAWSVRQYWEEKTNLVTDGKLTLTVPPHGTALLSVRPFDPARAQYLGSGVHISQGMELAGWEDQADGLKFKLSLNHQSEGPVDLYLPKAPVSITGNGEDVDFVLVDGQIYRLQVIFDKDVEIKVKF